VAGLERPDRGPQREIGGAVRRGLVERIVGGGGWDDRRSGEEGREGGDRGDHTPCFNDFTIDSNAARCSTTVASGPVSLKNQFASGPGAIAPRRRYPGIGFAGSVPIVIPPLYVPATSTRVTLRPPTSSCEVFMAPVAGWPSGSANCPAQRW